MRWTQGPLTGPPPVYRVTLEVTWMPGNGVAVYAVEARDLDAGGLVGMWLAPRQTRQSPIEGLDEALTELRVVLETLDAPFPDVDPLAALPDPPALGSDLGID